MLHDLQYAVRILLRRPGFTIAAILSLALGIGATTAIFSVVNAVALRPLPYADPDRLVWMTELLHGSSTDELTLTPHYLEWRRQAKSFASLAGYQYQTRTLTGDDNPRELEMAKVSAALLPLIGVTPALGRNFTVQEDSKGNDHVAILTDALWRNRFAADSHIAGRPITLDGVQHIIVGVLPRGFVFPGLSQVELLIPLGKDEAAELAYRDGGFTAMANVVGRLNRGASAQQATAELDTINARLPHPPWTIRITIDMHPLKQHLYGDAKAAGWILLAAAGFLLWIACANVSNLLLARLTERDRELSLRAVLGGSRGRLIAQLMTESGLLTVVACGLGVSIALWLRRPILAFSPYRLSGIDVLAFDWRVLLFAVTCGVATVILFGILPAFRATEFRLAESIKTGEAAVAGGRRSVRMLSIIVALEIATLLVLSTGAGVMLKSFYKMRYQNLGFAPDRLTAATIRLSGPRYRTSAQDYAFLDQILQQAQSIPGVESAAVTSFNEIPPGDWHATNAFFIEGRPVDRLPGHRPIARFQRATPNLFAILQIPLLKGQLFNSSGHNDVCIINRVLAEKNFRAENPIGHRLRWGPNDSSWSEIVGVVGDVKTSGLNAAAEPAIYYPYSPGDTSGDIGLIVKSPLGSETMATEIRKAVASIDPNQPVAKVETLDARLTESVSKPRFTAALLSAFAALAAILGIIGVYGVVSCRVRWQMREMAIRQALGAQPRDVVGHVLRQGVAMIAAGIAVGVAGSLGLSRLLSGFLYEVRANDPVTLIGSVALLSVVALAACWIPARRAASVDPLVLLRYE